jgi:hypothetical protein
MDARGSLPSPPGNADNTANVAGRRPAPPDTGFGQLWRKELFLTFTNGPAAPELMTYWKRHLHDLWPDSGDLYRDEHRLQEGDLLGIDLGVGPVKLATGVVVAESTDTSLTLLSPEGHLFAGWNEFSTRDTPEGTVASVIVELRASDPFYELGLLFGGHRAEEQFWAEMLWNLADRFRERPKVRLIRRRLDRRRQWRYAGNIRHNALMRTTIRRLARGLGIGGR